MKPKLPLWIVVFILVALIIFQQYVKDRSIERTIYFLILLIAFSIIATLSASGKFKLARTTKETRQQVGQYFIEKYEIENQGTWPVLWVILADKSHISLKEKQRVIAWIPGHGKRSYVSQSWLERRGIYTLGPTEVITGDPFGLFSSAQVFDSIEKIVILPRYQKITNFPDTAGYLAGGRARKTRNTEISPYAVSVRDYLPSDPLRRINWKASAKHGKLMVKEFEEDPQATVWVFLDADEKGNYLAKELPSKSAEVMSFWNRQKNNAKSLFESSLEYSISLAASVCDYYISNSRSVGFCSNCQQLIVLPPEGSVRQLDKVLEMLATIQPSEKHSIYELLLLQGTQLSKGNTIIILSSNSSQEFVEALRKLVSKGFSVILVSVTPSSFGHAIKTEGFYASVENLGVTLIVRKNGEAL